MKVNRLRVIKREILYLIAQFPYAAAILILKVAFRAQELQIGISQQRNGAVLWLFAAIASLTRGVF